MHQWLDLAKVVPSSPILDTLMMVALSSSATSVLTKATWNIPEDTILHSRRCENLKTYMNFVTPTDSFDHSLHYDSCVISPPQS
jgi:hypothetical protein